MANVYDIDKINESRKIKVWVQFGGKDGKGQFILRENPVWKKGTDFKALGFTEPQGISIKHNSAKCVKGMCQFLCTDCIISNEAKNFLSTKSVHHSGGKPFYEISVDEMKRFDIINEFGQYTPYSKPLEIISKTQDNKNLGLLALGGLLLLS